MIIAIEFLTFLLLMLVTGVFWGPWLALHRSLFVFKPSEFVKIVHTLAINVGRPMSIMMPLCILFDAASVFIYPDKSGMGFCLILLSLISVIVSLIITAAVEVPIVTEIKGCTAETLPANWEAKRGRWVNYHRYRMWAGIASFASYTAAILCLFSAQ